MNEQLYLEGSIREKTSSPRWKVIGFDSWAGGAHHFERLVSAFRDCGMDLILLHLGSWGGDPGRPVEERFGALQVRDIAYYGRWGFPDILAAENPEAVLFLSTDTFAHRAFNRSCRQRGLPTMHLYHGVVTVQSVSGGQVYKIDFFAQVRYVSSRLIKALKRVWPAYISSLWRTGATWREWVRFGQDVIRLALGRHIQESAGDARTDRCGVYVDADIDHAVKKYGFLREQVIAVGNPDLIQFGLSSNLIGSQLGSQSVGRCNVMYIDTGLIFTGCVFSSAEDFIHHMVDTKSLLESQGRRLLFKPHPQHSTAGVTKKLQECGVEICANEDFVPNLRSCCACIVETSSAAMIPALMGLPLFLAKYGKFREQRFGEVLTSYPRARYLFDVNGLNSLLAAEQLEYDEAQARQWIERNAGPLPAEEMPRRVAEVVRFLIVEHRKICK